MLSIAGLFMAMVVCCPVTVYASSSNMWPNCEQVATPLVLNCEMPDAYSFGCTYFESVTIKTTNLESCRGSVLMVGGRVEAGAANGIRIETSTFAGYEVLFLHPLNITIRDIVFGTNAILQFEGPIPPSSSLAIINNSFAMTNMYNHNIYLLPNEVVVVAAIIIGSAQSAMELTNNTNVTIAYNDMTFFLVNVNGYCVGISIPLSTLSVANSSIITIADNVISNSTLFLQSTLVAVLWGSWDYLELKITRGSQMVVTGNLIEDSSVGNVMSVIWFAYSTSVAISLSKGSALNVNNNAILNVVVERATVVVWSSKTGLSLFVTDSSSISVVRNSMINASVTPHSPNSLDADTSIVELVTVHTIYLSNYSRLQVSGNVMLQSVNHSGLNVYAVKISTNQSDTGHAIVVTNNSTLAFDRNALRAIEGPQKAIVVSMVSLGGTLTTVVSSHSTVSYSNNALKATVAGSAMSIVRWISGTLTVTSNSAFVASRNILDGCRINQEFGQVSLLDLQFAGNVTANANSTISAEYNSIQSVQGQNLHEARVVSLQAAFVWVRNSSRVLVQFNSFRSSVIQVLASVVYFYSDRRQLEIVIERSSEFYISRNDLFDIQCQDDSRALVVTLMNSSIAVSNNALIAISHNSATQVNNYGAAELYCLNLMVSYVSLTSNSTLEASNNSIQLKGGSGLPAPVCIAVHMQLSNLGNGFVSISYSSSLIMEYNRLAGLTCDTISAIQLDADGPVTIGNGSSWLMANTQLLYLDGTGDGAVVATKLLAAAFIVANESAFEVGDILIQDSKVLSSINALNLGTDRIFVTTKSNFTVQRVTVRGQTGSFQLVLIAFSVPSIELALYSFMRFVRHLMDLSDGGASAASALTLIQYPIPMITIHSYSELTVGDVKLAIHLNSIASSLLFDLRSHIAIGTGALLSVVNNDIFAKLSVAAMSIGDILFVGDGGTVAISNNYFELVESDQSTCTLGVHLANVSSLAIVLHSTLTIDGNTFNIRADLPNCSFIKLDAMVGIAQTSISSNSITTDTNSILFIGSVSLPPIFGRLHIDDNHMMMMTNSTLPNATFCLINYWYSGNATRYFFLQRNTIASSNIDDQSYALVSTSIARTSLFKSIFACQNKVFGQKAAEMYFSPAWAGTMVYICPETSSLGHTISNVRPQIATEESRTFTLSNTFPVLIDQPRKIIPVPVPPTTTAALSLVASAVGGTTTAVDAQTIAVIGLVACSSATNGDADSLRSLSVAALDNTCEGVLLGNTIVVLAAAFLSAVAVAASRIILVKKYRLARASGSSDSMSDATPPTLANACGYVRAPQLFLSLCVYFMNSYAVCGLQLSRSDTSSSATKVAAVIAFIFPIVLLLSYPIITYLFGARRLMAVRYAWEPKQLASVGSAVFQSWALDPIVGSDKLFGCVFGSYRWLGCHWSLVPHLSFLSSLPLIIAIDGSCGPLFALSAALYFIGALLVVVSLPRRSTASDVLHSVVLLVNGLIVANAAVLVLYPEHVDSSAARATLDHLGTAITILSVLRVAQSVGTIGLSLLVQRGIVGGVTTGASAGRRVSSEEEFDIELPLMTLGNESVAPNPKVRSANSNVLSQGCLSLKLRWTVLVFEVNGLWWPLPRPSAVKRPSDRVTATAGDSDMAAILDGLLSLPPMGLPDSFDAAEDDEGGPPVLLSKEDSIAEDLKGIEDTSPTVRPYLANRLSQYYRNNESNGLEEQLDMERYLTEEERHRRELAMEFLRQQLREMISPN